MIRTHTGARRSALSLVSVIAIVMVLVLATGCNGGAATEEALPTPEGEEEMTEPAVETTGEATLAATGEMTEEPGMAGEVQDITVTVTADGYEVPGDVHAGLARFTYEGDVDSVGGTPFLVRLNDDADQQAFLDTLSSGDDQAAVEMVTLYGGASRETDEGMAAVEDLLPVTYNLDAGSYLILNLDNEQPVTQSFEVAEGDAMMDDDTMVEPEPDIEIDLVDFAYGMPPELPGGAQTWHVVNTGTQWHEMFVAGLGAEMTNDEILSAVMSSDMGEEAVPMEGTDLQGTGTPEAGMEGTAEATLETTMEAGTAAATMEATVETGTAAATMEATAETGTAEATMEATEDTGTPEATLEAMEGTGTPEATLEPADMTGTPEETMEAAEGTSAPGAALGDIQSVLYVAPLSAGQEIWVETDLEAGNYVAICFLPDFESGQSHAELGMIMQFTVAEPQ